MALVGSMPWRISFPEICKSLLGVCLCSIGCMFCCCVKAHSDHCGFGGTGVTTLCFRYLYCSCMDRGVRTKNAPHIFCIFQFLVSPVFTFSIFSQPMCMSIDIGIGHWQGHGHWLGHGVGIGMFFDLGWVLFWQWPWAWPWLLPLAWSKACAWAWAWAWALAGGVFFPWACA